MAEEKKTVKKASPKKASEVKYVNRLVTKYNNEVVPTLVKEFGYTTPMQAPKFEKIVINIGVGDATTNSKALDDAVSELATITGQHPVVTKAKKSIATFKVRQGQAISVEPECMNSMINWFPSLSHVSVTSAAFPRTLSMAMVTTPSVSRNN